MVDSSYSADPLDSDLDRIRDLIGDVDSDAYILNDAEIEAELAAQSNLYIAAANCCLKCLTRLGEYDKLANLFQRRADNLILQAKRARFGSAVAATVGKVKDVATYPERFKQGEESPVVWDIDV